MHLKMLSAKWHPFLFRLWCVELNSDLLLIAFDITWHHWNSISSTSTHSHTNHRNIKISGILIMLLGRYHVWMGTSRACHSISNDQQFDCLFNSLLRLIHADNKENICLAGPLCGESISNKWIPLTKGQLCGKLFHIMKSSWDFPLESISTACFLLVSAKDM